MTARITPGQGKQLVRFCEDGIVGLNLEKGGAQRVIMQGDAFQTRLKEMILELASTFFIPVKDVNVPSIHHHALAKYRAGARQHPDPVPDTTPLCYRVFKGYTLKEHAPKAGPCYKNFQYLQNWNFNDEPTQDCLVFWIPRLVPGSTGKTVDEQKIHLVKFGQRLELPTHHCSSFGSAALLSGMILAHYKATGEQVPLNGLWTRTDSCDADGGRLFLFWLPGGLLCVCWDWVGGRDGSLGCFALGVETLRS